MADAAFCFSDERFTERCLGETEIDLNVSAARFHLTRRGGLERYTEIVQATGPGQTGVDRRVKDIVVVAQKLFHMFEREALQEILGRDAGPGRKQAVKVERAQPDGVSERVQIWLISMMSIQKPDHIGDSFVIIHTGSLSLVSFLADSVFSASHLVLL